MIISKDQQNWQYVSKTDQEEKKAQMPNARNKKGDISTDAAVFKNIIRWYYVQLYTSKFKILHEIGKFL